MNKSFHNIEYRPLLPTHNYRIGYDADGFAWRIRKGADGWRAIRAIPDRQSDRVVFTCRTLADVSAQLKQTGSKAE